MSARPPISEAQIQDHVDEFLALEPGEHREKELRRLYSLADLCMTQAMDLGILRAELNDARRQMSTMTRVIEHLMSGEDD